MSNIIEKLTEIQKKLNAPKNQRNNFGNYNYRSCEDILQAVKPLLVDSVILVSDEIQLIGDRFYVKATATFKTDSDQISVSAYARESFDKKGMDAAQITGATSSYARKYALNGLLLIDDNKDADSMDNSQKPQHVQQAVAQQAKRKQPLTDERLSAAIERILNREYTTQKLYASFDLTKAQIANVENAIKQQGAAQ